MVLASEIVTQTVLRASAKIALACEIPAHVPDILGEDSAASGVPQRKGFASGLRVATGALRARRAWRRMGKDERQ